MLGFHGTLPSSSSGGARGKREVHVLICIPLPVNGGGVQGKQKRWWGAGQVEEEGDGGRLALGKAHLGIK